MAYREAKGAWGACLKLNRDQNLADSELGKLPENCLIKGNVSGTKSAPKKTYHTPLSPWYGRVKPEKCFSTESEAEREGFTKVK
jgi:hypothetical protein